MPAPERRRLRPLALLLAAACASAPEPPPDSERSHSRALARKLAGLRAEIEERGLTPKRALDFALLARGEYRSAVRRGEARPDRAVTDEAIAYLEDASRSEPEAIAGLLTAAAGLHELRGDIGDAAAAHGRLIAAEPDGAAFRRLLELPRGEAVDAAVVAACPHLRPLADERDALDLTLVCLDAAGDARALTWTGVEDDLERLAGELGEAQQADELADARIRLFSPRRTTVAAIAAVFGAGHCHVDNCGRGGWTGRGLDGDVHVRCGPSGCLRDGWDARLPGGLVARTACHARDCVTRGWRTTYPDGQVADTRCLYDDCLRSGWTTTLPDESMIHSTCTGGDCRALGWTTTLAANEQIRCTCVRERCDNHGARCQ